MSSSQRAKLGGPLGDLMAPAPEPGEIPFEPVHARALEVTLGSGDVPRGAWALAAWTDPGDGRALHALVKERVEATILQELSRTARSFLEDGRKRFDFLWLFAFGHLTEPAAALRAFGLAETPRRHEMQLALAHLRQEAARIEHHAPDDPIGVYETTVARQSSSEQLEETLIEATGNDVWGNQPGAFFGRLAQAAEQHGLGTLSPDMSSLRRLEAVVLPSARGSIRWVPPMVFQGVADLVGLLADAPERRVEWAVCEADEYGVHPPPLLRLPSHAGRHVHLPVGLELLRWWVMPAQPGERIPSLAEWAEAVIQGTE